MLSSARLFSIYKYSKKYQKKIIFNIFFIKCCFFLFYLIFIVIIKLMEKYLNRRIWDKDLGLCYFCTICGSYKPEKEFYKSKRTAWGKDTRCKIHTKNKEKDDGTNNHLKLSKVKEEDFLGARELLKKLGYDTSNPHHSIYNQFLIKHKLNQN